MSDDVDREVERRLSKCPAEIRPHLVKAQNELLQAREAAARAGRMMTEAAANQALEAVRQALRLCENGS